MDLKSLVLILAQLTLWLIIAAIGMRAQWKDVVTAMRNWPLVIRGLIAVNVVVPFVAVVLCTALPMEEAIRIGIVIMAVSPLAPLVTGKMAKAGVETSFAVGLYVALILCAVVIVPATVALLSALYPPDASISVPSVIAIVIKSVLAPLAVGLVIGTAVPALAQRLAKWFALVGNVGLLLILAPILFAHSSDIFALVGDGVILAIVAAVTAGVVAGHWLGGPSQQGRTAIALAASMRHPGIALLITRQNFTDPRLIPAIELFLLISLALSSLYLFWLKKRSASVQPKVAAL